MKTNQLLIILLLPLLYCCHSSPKQTDNIIIKKDSTIAKQDSIVAGKDTVIKNTTVNKAVLDEHGRINGYDSCEVLHYKEREILSLKKIKD